MTGVRGGLASAYQRPRPLYRRTPLAALTDRALRASRVGRQMAPSPREEQGHARGRPIAVPHAATAPPKKTWVSVSRPSWTVLTSVLRCRSPVVSSYS